MRFLLVLFSLLAGCSVAPTHPASTDAVFELDGRISARYDDRGYYGNLHWVHRADSDEFTILSPLGQTMAVIQSSPAGASLTTGDQSRYVAPDVEALTEKMLGWRLPLKGLHHWVRAAAIPGLASQSQLGEDGKLKSLRQGDWSIDYQRYYPETGLPREIRMEYPMLQIRLLVDDWVKP